MYQNVLFDSSQVGYLEKSYSESERTLIDARNQVVVVGGVMGS